MAARRLAVRVFVLAALLALIPAVGLGPAPVAAAASIPVRVIFTGRGTYTINQSYQASGGKCTTQDVMTLAWSVTYKTTIKNGVLQGGPGLLDAGLGPGGLSFTIGGICPYQDTVPSCATTLSLNSLTAFLAVEGSDPQRVQAQSLPSAVTAAMCAPTEAPFIGRDLYFLNQALPNAMTAVADIPRDQVEVGYGTAVDSARAPGPFVLGDCTGQGPGGGTNTFCYAELKWTGVLTIACAASDQIATVTNSEGAAPAKGSPGCAGQAIKTGKNGRAEVTFDNGSTMLAGPNTEVDDLNESKTPGKQPTLIDRFELSVGRILYETGKAVNEAIEEDLSVGGATVGVRGSEFTASRDKPDGPLTLHVIAGQGFIRFAGKPEVDFPAGYTVVTDGTTYSLTTDWPAADQALAPKSMLPPALSNVVLTGSGAGLKVSLKLNTSAALVVMVKQGDKTIATAKVNGKKGTNSLAPLKADLPPGSYTVVVSATKSKRVSVVELLLVAPGLASPVASPIATPGG